jgi:predicted ATP-dependent endonuclease of OLD family
LAGVKSGDKIKLNRLDHKPFDSSPNISKLILVSYSPFEDYELDLDKFKLIDKDIYKYFGFRHSTLSKDGRRRIGISRNLPATDSVQSIITAINDDTAFDYLRTRTNKFDTILEVLKPALGFNQIAIEINKNAIIPDSISNEIIFSENDEKKYLAFNSKKPSKTAKILEEQPEIFKFQSGVIFLENGKRIELSSGQRLFCYIVINIVGQIKNNSLIIVDEPELFLHPTLEIEFISLLKKVLISFRSKAILATHSLAIAREVPAKCMHVYKKIDKTVLIDHPPFETFGGDMQRISSHVFGDIRVSKPFSQWVDDKIKEIGEPSKLLELLKGELNEEMMIKIMNSGVKNGR